MSEKIIKKIIVTIILEFVRFNKEYPNMDMEQLSDTFFSKYHLKTNTRQRKIPEEDFRCKCMTVKNERCRNKVLDNNTVCLIHFKQANKKKDESSTEEENEYLEKDSSNVEIEYGRILTSFGENEDIEYKKNKKKNRA